jgi:hypothetical protein
MRNDAKNQIIETNIVSKEIINEKEKVESVDDPLHKNENQGQKIEIIADENAPIDYSDDEEEEEDS